MSPLAFGVGFAVFVASTIGVIVCCCILGKRADEQLRRWRAERLADLEKARAAHMARDLPALETLFELPAFQREESRR